MASTLFYMWEPFRQHILKGHNFYIEQTQQRLLSQFGNLEEEAEKFGEEWLEESGRHFDPENHDPGDFYEQAYEESINFYQMLDDMQNRTRLSVISGMFHEWEKQFKSWTTKEISRWHRGEEIKKAVWKADFYSMINLFECLGWEIRKKNYSDLLDKCRLVVNAFKHGDGSSLEDIRKSHPEFLIGLGGASAGLIRYSDHTDLRVEVSHVDEFSKAIIAFWKDVPEYIFDQGEYECLPKWFEKALKKDAESRCD